MSALPLRGCRVVLHTWDVYDVIIDATSQEDALAKAEALYNAEGSRAFSHHNIGCEGFNCEDGV